MPDHTNIFHDYTILEDIRLIKKSFTLPLDKVQEVTQYHFEINIADSLDRDEEQTGKIFFINKSIDIKVLGEKEGEEGVEFGSFGLEYTFKVNNEKEFITFPNDSYKMKEDFDEWLDNVILATTRGYMYSEFRGTYIDNVVFPLMKPSELRQK
jgi:hypothetical protein